MVSDLGDVVGAVVSPTRSLAHVPEVSGCGTRSCCIGLAGAHRDRSGRWCAEDARRIVLVGAAVAA